MARLKVNLLPREAEAVRKTNVAVKWLSLASKMIVGVFVLLIAILFGIYFLLRAQLVQVKANVEQARIELEQSGDQELKYRLYQAILNEADKVIKDRIDYKGIFDDVNGLLPAGVSVGGLTFDKGLVVFEGRANGVQAFARALNSFSNIGEGDGRFAEAALTNVSRGPDGIYLFRLEISLRK